MQKNLGIFDADLQILKGGSGHELKVVVSSM